MDYQLSSWNYNRCKYERKGLSSTLEIRVVYWWRDYFYILYTNTWTPYHLLLLGSACQRHLVTTQNGHQILKLNIRSVRHTPWSIFSRARTRVPSLLSLTRMILELTLYVIVKLVSWGEVAKKGPTEQGRKKLQATAMLYEETWFSPYNLHSS